MPSFQTRSTRGVDRAHHVWFYDGQRRLYKCCLCGGVTAAVPPPHPPPGPWLPDRFEPLTDLERRLCPPPARKGGGRA